MAANELNIWDMDPNEWSSSLPTTLKFLNANPPIVGSQFEIWYNRWPHARWLAQGISVPGLKSNTFDMHFAGFTIPVIVNTTYSDTEISMDILADENGKYYDEWRTLVIEHSSDPFKGRPILENVTEDISTGSVRWGTSYIVAKLFNPIEGRTTGHCWRIHNFKPTSIGEIEMGHDSTDLVTFTVTGVFTHITYVNELTDGLLGFAAGIGKTTPPKAPNANLPKIRQINSKYIAQYGSPQNEHTPPEASVYRTPEAAHTIPEASAYKTPGTTHIIPIANQYRLPAAMEAAAAAAALAEQEALRGTSPAQEQLPEMMGYAGNALR